MMTIAKHIGIGFVVAYVLAFVASKTTLPMVSLPASATATKVS